MSLQDTIEQVRSGVLQLAFANAQNEKIGGGSAFISHGLVVTNHHVFLGHQTAASVGLRNDRMLSGQYRLLSANDFASRLVTGSQESSYDYAVLRIPEVVDETVFQFALETPGSRRIGCTIALLGFPLEHDNLTCHQGVISSFYESGPAKIIQLDASINAGNSGGPLIDPDSGAVIGVVTRKATGLSRLFKKLRERMRKNIEAASASGGMMSVGGLDPVKAFVASQHQMMLTLDEIERQANVGIGYAFSSEHLLAEPCFS
jgi:S1-C subfamily serine protease